jgi:hypothetical protein
MNPFVFDETTCISNASVHAVNEINRTPWVLSNSLSMLLQAPGIYQGGRSKLCTSSSSYPCTQDITLLPLYGFERLILFQSLAHVIEGKYFRRFKLPRC